MLPFNECTAADTDGIDGSGGNTRALLSPGSWLQAKRLGLDATNGVIPVSDVRKLTHLNDQGEAHMVDVGGKSVTTREATAEATVRMQPETLELIQSGGHKKGDVLAVARIAGIQAAKKCSDLIPLCHPLMLTKVSVEFDVQQDSNSIRISATCGLDGKTGVEMEALTAASVAALTIYDMCKAVDKGMVIEQTRLLKKAGGKSGHWKAEK